MEKKGVGRPRDGNPEETRREILRAAAEAFARAGFVGATTRLVAARAGVNVATLHYHFGSKAGLYRAVLANALGGPLPALPAGEPAETVTRVVEVLFARGAERPALARLALLDSLAGPDRRAEEGPGERVRWVAEGLRPLLSSSNGHAAPDAEAAARAIVILVDASFLAEVAGPVADGAGDAEDAAGAPAGLTPSEAARSAVVAAAFRITGLG